MKIDERVIAPEFYRFGSGAWPNLCSVPGISSVEHLEKLRTAVDLLKTLILSPLSIKRIISFLNN